MEEGRFLFCQEEINLSKKGTYYITTAIAYTSRKPHIGNTYEVILTDAIARMRRAQGYDVTVLFGRRMRIT